MREIDPIREPSEALLSSALHRLASGSSRNAPAALQPILMERFRRHHRRHRQVKLALAAAVAACIVFIAGLAIMLRSPNGPGQAQNSTQAARPRQEATGTATQSNPQSQHEQKPAARLHEAGTGRTTSGALRGQDDGFVALPGYDSAISNGELQVVRVELSASDLRMLGAPVAGDLSDRSVTADFITDRDGTPYAVKLVQ